MRIIPNSAPRVKRLDRLFKMCIIVTMTKGARQLRQMFEKPRQADVAKRLGVGASYLSLLASGKRTPSMTMAAKIQRELGIPVEAWTR
jgi:transcriptional regulator with XRE-family HTH domain